MSALVAYARCLGVLGAVYVVGYMALAGPLWLIDRYRRRSLRP